MKSSWPWSEVVALAEKYFSGQLSKGKKVLELGCGFGPNIKYFLDRGWDYYAIEARTEAVAHIHKKYPTLNKKVTVSEDLKDKFSNLKFDLLLDRACLTHNTALHISEFILSGNDMLKGNGLFFSIDWFGSFHHEKKNATQQLGKFTYSGFKKGQFKDIQVVNFINEKQLKTFFREFKVLELIEKNHVHKFKSQIQLKQTFNIIVQKNA